MAQDHVYYTTPPRGKSSNFTERDMITIIFGAPGTGKTSLNTHFLQTEYKTHGRALLAQTQKRIAEVNRTRVRPLALPDKPPIFANYKASFKIGYEKTFEPYYINPFYLGLENGNMPTQYLPPQSRVFISEAQRYYNSRKSSTLPDWVSRLYEMHRHYGMEIFLDVQRANLIDLNIKEICKRFIEVREMRHEQDYAGRILRTRFSVREFDCWRAVEQYMETGAKTFRSVTHTHEGNIFRCFDSYSYFEEFLPDEGKDFKYLPFLTRAELKKAGADAAFYKSDEPAEYRGQAKKPAKEKTSA